MHVLFGWLGFAGVLALTLALERTSGFTGLLHPPALILVGLGPPCIALIAFPPSELRAALRALLQTLRRPSGVPRPAQFEALIAFATAVRQRKLAEALELAERSVSPALQRLGPLVLKQYSPEDLEATATTSLQIEVSTFRRSEEVFSTLAKVAPATGLVGTVLGLIHLLKDLHSFDQLGPAMALALLCTLYGLILANAVYQPLARTLRTRAVRQVEDARLITRGLLLLAAQKPVVDLRRLFDAELPAAAEAPDAALSGS